MKKIIVITVSFFLFIYLSVIAQVVKIKCLSIKSNKF